MEYNRIGLIYGKLLFEFINSNCIWVKCVECMEKKDDQVAVMLKKDDEWCEYLIFQCEEAKNEINSNPLDYKDAIDTLVESINEENESHHD